MDKSPDAFRTISEVADHLDTPAHVLRFWESRFPQIKPVKRAGGRRYYRPSDVALLTGIKRLLHDEGLTIRGVQKILRDQGVRHVAGLIDDSVSMDALLAAAAKPVTPPAAVETAPGGTLAEPRADAGRAGAPATGFPPLALGAQSGLPLFDTPPAFRQPAPAPEPEPVARKRPTQRDDVTFASRIRGLPKGGMSGPPSHIVALADRLTALRNRLATRAEGGNA
jgi:DNA-binding transcriptional MerR regulator